jgi:hypothetical protein
MEKRVTIAGLWAHLGNIKQANLPRDRDKYALWYETHSDVSAHAIGAANLAYRMPFRLAIAC